MCRLLVQHGASLDCLEAGFGSGVSGGMTPGELAKKFGVKQLPEMLSR